MRAWSRYGVSIGGKGVAYAFSGSCRIFCLRYCSASDQESGTGTNCRLGCRNPFPIVALAIGKANSWRDNFDQIGHMLTV